MKLDERLEAALLAVEWDADGDIGKWCPSCGGTQSHGHYADCRIGAALNNIGQPPKPPPVFVKYRRVELVELADWTPNTDMSRVSVSFYDEVNGSPKAGDKIARNPYDHAAWWLVSAEYFAANFESIDAENAAQAIAKMTEEMDKLVDKRTRTGYITRNRT